jgi:hypothetical protein
MDDTMEINRWHIYEKHKKEVSDIGLTDSQYVAVVRAINDAIFDTEELCKPDSEEENQN